MGIVTRIYLAAEAGQPMSPAAVQGRDRASASAWADPGLRAHEGRRSLGIAEAARTSLASSLGAPNGTFTTHANLDAATRAAILGLGEPPVLLSGIERRSTLAWAQERSGPSGALIVRVDEYGVIDLTHWRELLAAGAGVAVLQVGNPELGTLQPVAAAAAACASAGVPLILDASMAVGRMPVPDGWHGLLADARSWAGGELAVLLVRAGTRYRPGPTAPATGAPATSGYGGCPTVADLAAAALGLESALDGVPAVAARDLAWTSQIRELAPQLVPDLVVHGAPTARLPHVVALSALYVDAEALLLELDRRGIAVASGSACAADGAGPSHVLTAVGALTSGNIRVSIPLAAREDEIARFLAVLPEAVRAVRLATGVSDL